MKVALCQSKKLLGVSILSSSYPNSRGTCKLASWKSSDRVCSKMQVSAHIAVLLFIVPQVLTLIAEENTTWTSKVAVSSPASSHDGQTCRNKDHDASSNGTNACPLGYYCSNGTCQCLTAPRGIVSCSEDGLYNYAVLDCYCVTYNLEESLTQKITLENYTTLFPKMVLF